MNLRQWGKKKRKKKRLFTENHFADHNPEHAWNHMCVQETYLGTKEVVFSQNSEMKHRLHLIIECARGENAGSLLLENSRKKGEARLDKYNQFFVFSLTVF